MSVARIWAFTERLVLAALVGLFAAMVVACTAQVIWRYLFNDPLVWSEELARYRVTHLVTVGFNPATEALAEAARGQGVHTLEVADAAGAAAEVEALLAAPPAGAEGWRERRDRDCLLYTSPSPRDS